MGYKPVCILAGKLRRPPGSVMADDLINDESQVLSRAYGFLENFSTTFGMDMSIIPDVE